MGANRGAVLAAMVVVFGACASATGPVACASHESELRDSMCLDTSGAPSLDAHATVVRTEVGRVLDLIAPRIDVAGTRIRLIDDAAGTIPEVGLGGFNPGPNEIRIYVDPGRTDLAELLVTELGHQIAHELHHAARRRSVGYGATLLEAAVTEGLADHFALEITGGAPPPWSTALPASELSHWVAEVVARDSGAYDHATWFHGTSPDVPRWTGYAVGFELVRRVLDANPSLSAAALTDRDARDFTPNDPTG